MDGFAMDGLDTGKYRSFLYSRCTQARAVFAELGHTFALLGLLIAATALKFTVNDFPRQSAIVRWSSFGRESAAVAAALALAVPLVVAAANLAPSAGVRRIVWLAISTPVCVIACVESPLPELIAGVTFGAGTVPQLGAVVVLLVVAFEFRQRALASAAAFLSAEIRAVTMDARLRDARLRVLQAQIAPHFLFNTLANVRRLAQIDRCEAASMLGDLAQYFSATLARRDSPCTSLADEGRLVDAYLRIHRIRMGSRLAYAIDIPEALAEAEVPTMMLLTLVENAIKHGIDPLAEGGFVRLRAERHGHNLRIEIADSGRGLTAAEGHGVGLANIRARLSMLYGPSAELVLAHGRPRGLIAAVSLPYALRTKT